MGHFIVHYSDEAVIMGGGNQGEGCGIQSSRRGAHIGGRDNASWRSQIRDIRGAPIRTGEGGGDDCNDVAGLDGGLVGRRGWADYKTRDKCNRFGGGIPPPDWAIRRAPTTQWRSVGGREDLVQQQRKDEKGEG